MTLYDKLLSRVSDNRNERAELFKKEMHRHIDKHINSTTGYKFPINIRIRLNSRDEACDEFMCLIKEILHEEGFNNFNARFGYHDADVREFNAVSFSYVDLVIGKNEQGV